MTAAVWLRKWRLKKYFRWRTNIGSSVSYFNSLLGRGGAWWTAFCESPGLWCLIASAAIGWILGLTASAVCDDRPIDRSTDWLFWLLTFWVRVRCRWHADPWPRLRSASFEIFR